MDMPHIAYPIISQETFDLLPFLAHMNNDVMNIHVRVVYIDTCSHIFNFIDYIAKSGISE